MRRFIIPDALCILVALCALVIQASVGATAVTNAFLGGLLALAIFEGTRRVMTWRLGRDALGMGDVKLMTAGALWIGLSEVPIAILMACLFALVAFVALSCREGASIRLRKVPFGPFISLGLMGAKALQFYGL